jgi:antitoxin PrlF
MNAQAKTDDQACCAVEALISVDERGQMVLPKDVREAAGIRPGDKLALIAWKKDGAVCCMSLIKADELRGMVKGKLGPLMKDIIS